MVNNAMTFEEFAAAYTATFAKMMSYKLTEVGSDIYCEKLVDLAESYPDFLAKFEAEQEAA